MPTTVTHSQSAFHELPEWNQLQQFASAAKQRNLADYFTSGQRASNPLRFEAAGLCADLSRHHIDEEILATLLKLAEKIALPSKIKQLIDGEKLNFTEDRPALHTTLRSHSGPMNCQQLVQQCLQKMQSMTQAIHTGQWLGYSGKPIKQVVNIGVGGSDLGPRMAALALSPYHSPTLTVCFVSNFDPSDIEQALAKLDPETTLFTVASKTWTTMETLANANTAKAWLQRHALDADISNHFIAISSQPERCQQYGIKADNILPMWDWVGGRYSLWSAIGLPIALATSFDHFSQLLNGAQQMDDHFATSPLQENIPVLMALLEIWYVNFWDAGSLAILPYDHNLRLLPDHLQQLIMESNGKHVSLEGASLPYHTCPIIFGTAGTNGQHSFHQLLHQGTQFIPVDFILPLTSHSSNTLQHSHLVANCLAQAQALMDGTSKQPLAGLTEEEQQLARHKAIPGNKPSTLISMQQLTPSTLGALIALYEHKVFAASCLWHINPFDQWGVELGKSISSKIHSALSCNSDEIDNPATANAIADYIKARSAN